MREPGRRRELRRWLVLWALFSTLGGTWALASPLYSIPDETAHAVYAAAAVRGDVWGPTTGIQTTVRVPLGYGNAPDVPRCFVFNPEQPADCAQGIPDSDRTTAVTTTAGRYPPGYYLYAGLGSLATGGFRGLYLMRALTVVATAALLASATCSVLGQRRSRYSLAGLGLALTPMLFFLTGGINPQSLEIAGGVLLWTSGARLLQSLRTGSGVRLSFGDPTLRRVVVAMLVLTVARPMSLFWLAVIVGFLLAGFGSGTALRRLASSRAAWAATGLILASGGFTLFWILARDSLAQQPISVAANMPLPKAILTSFNKLNGEYKQMIGVFGWLDTGAPDLVYVLFTMLLGALLLTALRSIPRRQLLTVAALLAVVAVFPRLLELREYRVTDFAWQGRYTLPLAVGVPILLGFFVDHSRADSTPVADRRTLRFFAAGLFVVQVTAFIGALNRNVNGVSEIWFTRAPAWHPPLPSLMLITMAVATCGALAWLLARQAGPESRPAHTLPPIPPMPAAHAEGAPLPVVAFRSHPPA